jgi:hypothetical protein
VAIPTFSINNLGIIISDFWIDRIFYVKNGTFSSLNRNLHPDFNHSKNKIWKQYRQNANSGNLKAKCITLIKFKG